jgi:hypothetical protein
VVAHYMKPIHCIGELPINGDLAEVRPILYGLGRKQTECGPFATALEVLNDDGRIGSNGPGVPGLRNPY